MTPYIITETIKARVCLVNGISTSLIPLKINVVGEKSFLSFKNEYDSFHTETLPPGDWQLLPRLSQVSEEQAAGIVDELEYPVLGKKLYKNYTGIFNGTPSSVKALISLSRSLNIPEDQDPVVLVEFKK